MSRRCIELKDPVLSQYQVEINRIPILSLEEEHCVANCMRMGNQAAKDRLVESCLRSVVYVAGLYLNRGMAYLDLISVGNLGVMKHIHDFDPKRGRLATFVSVTAKREIKLAFMNELCMIRKPVHVYEMRSYRRRKLELPDRWKKWAAGGFDYGDETDGIVFFVNNGEPKGLQAASVMSHRHFGPSEIVEGRDELDELHNKLSDFLATVRALKINQVHKDIFLARHSSDRDGPMLKEVTEANGRCSETGRKIMKKVWNLLQQAHCSVDSEAVFQELVAQIRELEELLESQAA